MILVQHYLVFTIFVCEHTLSSRPRSKDQSEPGCPGAKRPDCYVVRNHLHTASYFLTRPSCSIVILSCSSLISPSHLSTSSSSFPLSLLLSQGSLLCANPAIVSLGSFFSTPRSKSLLYSPTSVNAPASLKCSFFLLTSLFSCDLT